MSLSGFSLSVNFGAHTDTGWITPIEQTERRTLGNTGASLDTYKWSPSTRTLTGITTTDLQMATMDSIMQSQTSVDGNITFTDDQSVAVTVFIKSLIWRRVFDIGNWDKREYTMVLLDRDAS